MERKILWIDTVNSPFTTKNQEITSKIDSECEVVWVGGIEQFRSYLNLCKPYPLHISIGENVGDGDTCIDVVAALLKDIRMYNTKSIPNVTLHFSDEKLEEEVRNMIDQQKRRNKC